MVAIDWGGRRRESASPLTLPLLPALAALLIATWALTRPYLGVIHDSRLYVLQALAQIDPVFAEDLFLAFGSQSSFTLFPQLHAAVIKAIGLEAANVSLLVLGHSLWIGALLLFARRLSRGPKLWIVAMAVIVMPGDYGGFSALAYAEGFLTPRLFAEAATLAALAALLGRHWRVALLIQVAAIAIHPLVALPGLGVILIYLVIANWRWVWAGGAIALAAAIAAAAGHSLAGRLVHMMDAEWFDLVSNRNTMVLASQWRSEDWYAAVASLALAIAGIIAVGGARRRLLQAIVAAALGGVGVSVLAGDWLGSTLVVQVQLWRSLWLVEVAATAGAMLVLFRLRHHRPNVWPIASLMLVALLGAPIEIFGGVWCAVAILVPVLVYAELRGRLSSFSVLTRGICFAFVGILILAQAGIEAYATHLRIDVFGPVGLLQPGVLLAGPPARLLLLVVLIALLGFMIRGPRPLAYLLSAAALAGSILVWDQRSDWSRMLEAGDTRPAFADSLTADAQVFWASDPEATWLLLWRPNYVSWEQGAGIVFNRETAAAYDRRRQQLGALTHRLHRHYDSGLESCTDVTRTPSASEVVAACLAAPELGFLVLPWRIPGVSATDTWNAPTDHVELCLMPDAMTGIVSQEFHLYGCEAVLEEARQALDGTAL